MSLSRPFMFLCDANDRIPIEVLMSAPALYKLLLQHCIDSSADFKKWLEEHNRTHTIAYKNASSEVTADDVCVFVATHISSDYNDELLNLLLQAKTEQEKSEWFAVIREFALVNVLYRMAKLVTDESILEDSTLLPNTFIRASFHMFSGIRQLLAQSAVDDPLVMLLSKFPEAVVPGTDVQHMYIEQVQAKIAQHHFVALFPIAQLCKEQAKLSSVQEAYWQIFRNAMRKVACEEQQKSLERMEIAAMYRKRLQLTE